MKVRTSHIHKHTSLTYIYGRVYTHTHMIIYVIVYMYIMSMSWLAFVTVFICFFRLLVTVLFFKPKKIRYQLSLVNELALSEYLFFHYY